MKDCSPNYTYFKTHDPGTHDNTDTEKYRRSIVKDKLTTKKN